MGRLVAEVDPCTPEFSRLLNDVLYDLASRRPLMRWKRGPDPPLGHGTSVEESTFAVHDLFKAVQQITTRKGELKTAEAKKKGEAEGAGGGDAPYGGNVVKKLP